MSLWVAGLKRLSFCSITGAGAGLEDGRFRQMALLEDGFQRGKGLNHDGAVATAFQLGLCVGTADGVVLKAERLHLHGIKQVAAIEHQRSGHHVADTLPIHPPKLDRKSTRLNSSHVAISYAVFC